MAAKLINGNVALRLLGAALVAGALLVPSTAVQAQEQPRVLEAQALGPNDGGGWAGIGIEDVTADKAKELKLPGEYGALVTEVRDDTPAAKAGIKQGDVITEYNGQRVEGAVELRRLVRETPAGRTVKITLWREGRTQTVSLEVGAGPADAGPLGRAFGFGPAPPNFAPAPGGGPERAAPRGESPEQFGFRGMPTVPFDGNGRGDRRAMVIPPALGVSGQDLSGQLGNYFSAPDGEGVLITDVPANSPGGKAGLKTGDVITEVDGERVHNLGELRDRLRDKQLEGKSVKLDVIRKGAAVSVSIQLEKPPAAPNRPGAGERGIPL